MTINGAQTRTLHKPTIEEKQRREYDLSEILIKLKEEHIKITDKELIKSMKSKGYSYDRFKLYKDKKAINQRNSFIRDLTEANVSKFYEDLYSRLDGCLQDAESDYNKLLGKPNSGKERRAIGYYMKHLTEQMDNMMGGTMMDISSALATRKIAKLSEDSEKLKNLLIKHGIDPDSGEKKRNANDVKLQESKIEA